MADNIALPATGVNAAGDEVTYSSDTATVQLVRSVLVTGSEGSKTVVDPAMGNGASGTSVQRVTLANDSTGVLATVSTVTTLTGGGIAHDGADSGNPVKVGARAISDLAAATMVSAADRVDQIADLDGAQIIRANAPLGNILSERVTDTGGTSTAFSTFGATASARNFITSFTVYNDSTTNGFLDIRDGTAGSVLITIPLPAKGGAHIPLPTPLRQPTANTALAYDVSAALTTVYITAVGFKSKA